MFSASWLTDSPLQSFVRDQHGPAYQDLRPGKPEVTTTFPVYKDLEGILADPMLDHPDARVAQVMATASGYAYSDVGTMAMMMTRLGLPRSRCRQVSRLVDAMLINASAQLVQSEDGRVVILAFRGTPPLDLITWFLNADVSPEQIASVSSNAGGREPFRVHAGFYRNVRMVRPELIAALLRACEQGSILGEPQDPSLTLLSEAKPAAESLRRAPVKEPVQELEALYVTGHSLGGAMASMFAAMLLLSDNDDYRRIASKLKGVYTFGQPMIGFEAFADAAGRAFEDTDVPLLRYVYKKDPVPSLPPDTLGKYIHFGQEYRLDKVGTWLPSADSEAMQKVAGVVTALLSYGAGRVPVVRDLPFRYKLEDHFPHHYVSALIPPGGTDEFGDYFPQPTAPS